MVDAATEFRKSGFGDEDAANLALIATMYQNVADEEISAGESANFIISQMKAFGIEADNAMHIIDAVNSVSNNYAVSSSDLANNLGKVSSALAVGGNSFEETLGMMTAITEITRNASTAARGLVSVQSRFNQIIDDTSSTGQKLTAFYEEHGIAIKDQDGQLRNLYDVLYDTSQIWDTLDENERKYFLNIQAGANQTRNLAALMENFGVAVSATETALNSAGSAATENERVMESLQGKINLLKAAWEDFATNTITKEFIGSILDAGTALLNFANTDMGRAITKALLFGTTLGAGVGFVGTFAGKIFELFGEMKKLGKAIDGPTTLLGKFLSVGTKGKWTLIALGIAGITTAVLALNEVLGVDKFEKFMSQAEDFAEEQEELQKKIQAAEQELENYNKIPHADRSQAQNEEIARLELLIAGYKAAAEEAEKAEKKAAGKALRELRKESVATGVSIGGTKVTKIERGEALKGEYTLTEYTGLSPEEIAVLTAEYGSLNEALYSLAKYYEIYQKEGESEEAFLRRIEGELETYDIVVGEVTQSWKEYISTQKDALKSSATEISKLETLTDSQIRQTQNLLDVNEEYYDKLKRAPYNQLTADEKRFVTAYESLEKYLQSGIQTTSQYNAKMEALKGVFGEIPNNISATKEQLKDLSYALVNNAELGIASVDDLRTVLSSLGDRGLINFDSIEGGLEGLLSWLQTLEGFDLPPKELDITAGEVEGVEESVAAVGEPEIVANIATVADATELATALENINTQLSSLPTEAAKVTIKADISDVNSKIGEIKTSIKNASGEVEVAVSDDSESTRNNLQTIKDVLSNISQTPTIVKVEADTALALARLNVIASYRIPNKSITVSCYDYASHILEGIIGKLAAIQNKTVVVTTIHHSVYTSSGLRGPRAKGDDNFEGGYALINDGAPVNGSSGELVVSDGMGTIYNNGEETIQNLPRGAKIYTAAETQKILKSRGLTVSDLDGNVIPSFADGTKNKYPDYRLDPNYSGIATLSGSGETLKENFDNWLKEKKHFLALDIISEAQYYRDLEIMNERYLKNMADYRDDYWKHEEEIYDWRNQSLEEQITLEEKLSELAKAKTQRVLTYTGGRFQYLQNIEAIAAAQREVDRLTGRYADGTLSARGGLSLVGEEGPELRVLKSGDGIVPADATKNLLSLSRFNAKDIINAAKSNIMQYAFNISNLSLPNVQSPEDFVSGLRNLAYQYSFGRT